MVKKSGSSSPRLLSRVPSMSDAMSLTESITAHSIGYLFLQGKRMLCQCGSRKPEISRSALKPFANRIFSLHAVFPIEKSIAKPDAGTVDFPSCPERSKPRFFNLSATCSMDKITCRIRNPGRMGNLAGKGRMQENTSFPGDGRKDRVMVFSASIPSHSSEPLFAFILSSNIFDYSGFLIRGPFFGIFYISTQRQMKTVLFFHCSRFRIPASSCFAVPCL